MLTSKTFFAQGIPRQLEEVRKLFPLEFQFDRPGF